MVRRLLTRRRFVGLLAGASASVGALALRRPGEEGAEARGRPAMGAVDADARDLVPLALPQDGALWIAADGAVLLGRASPHG